MLPVGVMASTESASMLLRDVTFNGSSANFLPKGPQPFGNTVHAMSRLRGDVNAKVFERAAAPDIDVAAAECVSRWCMCNQGDVAWRVSKRDLVQVRSV